LPSLRDRAEDLFAIAQAIVAARGGRLDPAQVEVEAVERLMLHEWRANIRELAAILDEARRLEKTPGLRLETVERIVGAAVAPSAAVLTAELVQRALADTGGNESAAARKLGVPRGKLRRFLESSRGGPSGKR